MKLTLKTRDDKEETPLQAGHRATRAPEQSTTPHVDQTRPVIPMYLTQQNSVLGTHLRATERHLPYPITQCYLPPDTGERTPP